LKTLFQFAYFAALLLWIPLAMVAVVQPSVRRRVIAPLVASAIGAAYEAYMTFVWSHSVINPIRIDIFLVIFALGVVDAIAGFSLLVSARGRPDRKSLVLAGALCLGVPVLAIAGFVALQQHTADVDRNLDLARQFRFEAYFRDDQTEKRAFGELKPDKNPWAGYYVYAGSDDDRFAHLIINDEGRFWTYHSKLYEYKGIGSHGSTDAFEGVGDGRMNARMRLALRRQEGGAFLLDVNFGDIPQSPARKLAPMKKADPPRFPRTTSAGDEVRFAGVFSATYDEKNGAFWITQVWLWESGGQWWGQYLRDYYPRGAVKDFISTERISPACSEQCKVLSFKSGRGPVTLTRVSDDELSAVMDGVPKAVTLRRGETLPGFFLDLAPLATKKENRQWLDAVTTAGMISWKVPPVGQGDFPGAAADR